MNYSQSIQRKLTKKIKLGNVEIGGDAPISVQTITTMYIYIHIYIERNTYIYI